jgi:hypothetical protein
MMTGCHPKDEFSSVPIYWQVGEHPIQIAHPLHAPTSSGGGELSERVGPYGFPSTKVDGYKYVSFGQNLNSREVRQNHRSNTPITDTV